MVLHVKYAPVVTNCPFLSGCPISTEVLRLHEKSEQGGKFRSHRGMDVPLLEVVLLLSVVPNTGSGPGQGDDEGAGLQGIVIFVKVPVGLWCPSRLQKLLNISSLWLWVEWWNYPQELELFTLEFLMLVPSYCLVHVALLLSTFSSHQVPFFRPINLLIKAPKHPGPWLLIHPTG